jgi:5-methylcytosine-specific restriction endonuclease McrA
MAVFVLGKDKRPVDPCSEKRARKLLESGRARVHMLVPFVIRLTDRTVDDCVVHPCKLKLDPGSKTTGVAAVRETDVVSPDGPRVDVIASIQVEHRGKQIRDKLTARRAHRRHRRGNLRFRQPRFDNRRRKKGWLPPSLQSRVDNILSAVKKLCRLLPISSIDMELVRFDMQLMQNPEISGVEYQQGELQGYEVREYLLEKFGRCCAYCDATGVPLQIEHVESKARGGSNRVSNLTLACEPCNTKKGSMPVSEFLSHDPERLKRLKAQLKAPLRDAAAVNATRWALYEALKVTGLPVSTWSGGRTKWNRRRLGIPKTHALDAVCVGVVGSVSGWQVTTLVLTAMGRGSYCRTRVNSSGFPRGYLTRSKTAFGFATGDLVVADIPRGKHAGRHVGRIAIRARGTFSLKTGDGIARDVHHSNCRVVQRGNGYAVRLLPPPGNNAKQGASPPGPERPGSRREVF